MNPESPYAPGQEFGPELDTLTDDSYLGWRQRDRSWYGIGVPQFADEARAAAKGQATATGVPGFVTPPVKPISESVLAKAIETVEAARDRLMRSRREES